MVVLLMLMLMLVLELVQTLELATMLALWPPAAARLVQLLLMK